MQDENIKFWRSRLVSGLYVCEHRRPEPSLVAYVISTIISLAGSFCYRNSSVCHGRPYTFTNRVGQSSSNFKCSASPEWDEGNFGADWIRLVFREMFYRGYLRQRIDMNLGRAELDYSLRGVTHSAPHLINPMPPPPAPPHPIPQFLHCPSSTK